MKSVKSNNLSFKFQRCTPSGCKYNLRIRNFVEKAQFLSIIIVGRGRKKRGGGRGRVNLKLFKYEL